ncbi:DUF1413 domain-containing protein [Paenibacillus campi]|uniref:DUF1413 domain-containing protein n=1 Tax=Paenibacillus campi TaxID=3106031 RepID=UPI002AFE0C2D|nr:MULTISPECIES: DUF1413 domain-containing protein [unclassified Paenibacillus]
MLIDEKTSLEDLFKKAISTLHEVNSNDREFVVKDLFRGFEWNRIPKGNRTKLGSMFFNYAKNDSRNLIIPLGKTAQNQQLYKIKQ